LRNRICRGAHEIRVSQLWILDYAKELNYGDLAERLVAADAP
jgi:hypothetical protein